MKLPDSRLQKCSLPLLNGHRDRKNPCLRQDFPVEFFIVNLFSVPGYQSYSRAASSALGLRIRRVRRSATAKQLLSLLMAMPSGKVSTFSGANRAQQATVAYATEAGMVSSASVPEFEFAPDSKRMSLVFGLLIRNHGG